MYIGCVNYRLQNRPKSLLNCPNCGFDALDWDFFEPDKDYSVWCDECKGVVRVLQVSTNGTNPNYAYRGA